MKKLTVIAIALIATYCSAAFSQEYYRDLDESGPTQTAAYEPATTRVDDGSTIANRYIYNGKPKKDCGCNKKRQYQY